MFEWPVVPWSTTQLEGVNPQDILQNGLYIRRNVYDGDKEYEGFSSIYTKRFGERAGLDSRFVVQLEGCHTRCPTCYIAEVGSHRTAVKVSTYDLVEAYKKSGCSVFQLTGVAPAIHQFHWAKLMDALNGGEDIPVVFHSSFCLFEGDYSLCVLKHIADHPSCLFSVSIKGSNADDYYKNTNARVDMSMFWDNLDTLVDAGVEFYFTFTGMTDKSIQAFKKEVAKRYTRKDLLDDAFVIK